MQIIQGDIIEVIADEGMMLINKAEPEFTAHHLWLSINDSPSNWNEVEEVNTNGESWEDSILDRSIEE